METREIETPHGPARAHLHAGRGAARAARARPRRGRRRDRARPRDGRRGRHRRRVSVALVEQPYRVAGRKSPAPAHQLDAAWLAVVEALRGEEPVLCGGRSSGARVACRTAAGTGATGVLCLAFPLHPPGRPEKTRLGELEAVEVPVLIVQGESDPFGMPPEAPSREVVRLRGTTA